MHKLKCGWTHARGLLFKNRLPVLKTFTVTLSAQQLAKHRDDKDVAITLDTKECLKQASIMNVNSATSLLTTTLFLIDNLSEQYKNKIVELTALLEDCILYEGSSEELWDEVIALRNEMDSVKFELNYLIDHMVFVEKITTATVETTFHLNANYLCTTLCERCSLAQEKLSTLEAERRELESVYLLTQVKFAKYKTEGK